MTTIEDVLAQRAKWCVIEGDSRVVVPTFPAACINAVVTDPPSGISFMGAAWDHHKGGRAQWVAWLAAILAASRVACVDGARLVSWAMPRTSHWTGCAIEDAGWTIETKGVHLFGTGWPKGRSQLKPAAEDWWFARTGASLPLNIDAARVASGAAAARSGKGAAGVRPGGIEDRSSLEAYTAERAGEAAGRYPPNVTLGHADGCVLAGVRRVASASRFEGGAPRVGNVYGGGDGRERPAAGYADPDGTETVDDWRCVEGCPVRVLGEFSGESASSDRPRFNSARPITASKGAEAAHVTSGFSDTGTAARFFPQFQHAPEEVPFLYCAKPSRAEKNAGCEDLAQTDGAQVALGLASKVMRCAECSRTHPMTHTAPCVRCGGVVAIDDAANDGRGRGGHATKANVHPTVKPVDLMRWLIRLVTKPGDVVLDPFCGSATTGVAALLEGRRFIGIERAPDAGERAFAPIARARLEHAAPSRERLATMASTPVRVEAADFGPLFNR